MTRRILGWCVGWIIFACGMDFVRAVEPPCLGETRGTLLLRSGPGLHFYPTSEAVAGDRFAVIEIREDGWCAVEPPPGSFSWIHAGAVRGDGAIVRVVREAAVVRVGSEFADDKAVIQTYLENGDGVRPLPPPRDADPNWLRIEPPPGEVRWLRREDIGLRPFPPPPPTVAVAPPAPREVPTAPQLQVAPQPEVPAATPVAETVSRPRWLPDPLVQPAALTEEPAAEGMDTDGAERTLRQRSELISLHERLVRMTGNSPETWDLETLQRQAQTLYDEAETAVLRGEARALIRQSERLAKLKAEWKKLDATRLPAETERRLLAKIEADRIPSIRRTTAAVDPVPMPNVANPPSPPAPTAVAGNAPPEGAVRPAAEKLDPAAAGKTAGTLVRAIDPPPGPRYDVEGTLQENPIPLPGEPRFWVRGPDGSNKGFVTAAPGIHLRRYLGKHVGLTGHRQDGNPRGTAHFIVRHAEEARTAPAAKP